MIERAVITSQGAVLHVDIPATINQPTHLHKTLDEMECEYILQVLEDTHWTIGGSRMQKLGINRPDSSAL